MPGMVSGFKDSSNIKERSPSPEKEIAARLQHMKESATKSMNQYTMSLRAGHLLPHQRQTILRATAVALLVLLVTGLYLFQNFEPSVEGKVLVVYGTEETVFQLSLRQGMFVELHNSIAAVQYAKDHNARGVELIHSSEWYSIPGRDPNWFRYYFKSAEVYFDKQAKAEAPRVHFDRYLAKYGRFDSFHSYNVKFLTKDKSDPYRNYSVPVRSRMSLSQLREICANYFPLQDWVWEESKTLTPNVQDFIGVHFRGKDKEEIYPYYKMPMLPMIDSIKAMDTYLATTSGGGIEEQLPLYVATDEMAFVDELEKEFPGRRIMTNPKTMQRGAKLALHKDPSLTPEMKGRSAIVDMATLARARGIIKNKSTLSVSSLYYGPLKPWIMVLSCDDPIYASEAGIDTSTIRCVRPANAPPLPEDAPIRMLRRGDSYRSGNQ